jgi:hypothetical protein
VELLAYDNDASGAVCVDLYRAEPGNAAETTMGWTCTSNSGMTPQSQTFWPGVRRVNAGQRAYLWVSIDNPNVRLYGVRVTYTTNP